MMIKRTSRKAMILAALALVLFIPATAMAYLLPEEVLMGNDYFLPPSNRDMKETVERQAAASASRRAEEWELEYERQHPTPPEVEEEAEEVEEVRGGALMLTSDAMELLRTIRLLERVDKRQEVLSHEGAPPLAPTGAPAILAAVTMIGAAGWTVFRAGRKRTFTSKTIDTTCP